MPCRGLGDHSLCKNIKQTNKRKRYILWPYFSFKLIWQEADMGSIKLLKVKVEVFNTSFCNRAESYDGLITSNMFCAGDKRGQHDACQVKCEIGTR